jgi:type II secretory pathway pseudopilin PulG
MARRRLRQPQRGAALLIFLILVVTAALTYVVSSLTPEKITAIRQQKTEAALVKARDALLGYALKYREEQINDGQYDRVYGYLPLPDLGSSRNNNADPNCKDASNNQLEGCDAASNTTNFTVIGRFPWRTLGTEPLRDGNGECLWYVVSGSHDRIQRPAPMNWDTLGHLDVMIANGGATLASILTTAHDRPVAIIFSAASPLTGQDRSTSTTDDVSQCGGNYAVSNYLDPATAAALGGVTNYFVGADPASGDASITPKQMTTQGNILSGAGKLWPNACPQGTDCSIAANDRGLILTNDALFGTLRKSSNFRIDINSMLDRMVGCLRDTGITSSAHPLPTSTCYDNTQDPRGYFGHYQEQIFLGKCTGNCSANIDGVATNCPAVLILGNQRGAVAAPPCPSGPQLRTTSGEAACNYLEEPNLTSFTDGGTSYAGHSQFARVTPTHPVGQDIVRCIPAGASLTEAPSALPSGSKLARYDPATRTLTLGRQNIESDEGYAADRLFGCSWTPEVRATGSGFRSYFKLNIDDRGDGFVFAAIDGDRNGTNVCGAGEQHLGYSGNNGYTTPIAFPKIGLEFDTRKNYEDNPNPAFVPDGFYPGRYLDSPWTLRTLANGRSDPDYSGYHYALTYWGSESPVSTGYACWSGWFCPSPSFCDTDNICKLNQEEDDNVHGQLPSPPAVRPPPQNPSRVDNPATIGLDLGYYQYPAPYLPPALYPLNVNTDSDAHVRIEVERTGYAGRDDNSRLVKVVAATPLATLAGLQTIDTIALQAGDTVLVTAQADGKTNGVYLVAAGTWARAANANEAADLPPGTSWFVKEGGLQRGSLWRLQNIEAPVVGVSDLTIQRFREPVKAVATSNITPSGLQAVGGVTLATGDRILLTNQADAKENGVYAASTGSWGRAIPEDTAAGMKDGAMWFSTSGTGSYWRLNGNVTPGTSNIAINAIAFPSNNIYSATVTTKVWKLTDSASSDQITHMKITTRSMNQLDPVTKHGQCISGNTCPPNNPDGQSCGGVEADGLRYCYTGQKPNLYDSKQIFDIRGTTSCSSHVNCSGNQFCGIDEVCYEPAFRTMRLGFTNSQSSSDQEIDITDFFTTWLP